MMRSLPHFAVIGAQKSGTTSLCAFLESIGGVCMSHPKEPMFFSRDEAALHPHFFATHQPQWLAFDWQQHKTTLLEEYDRYFSHRAAGDLCGEGSTSYLLSQHTPERLHEVNPDCKIIVVMRDPASRAYSAYWHYVMHGIATEPFARHLQYEGGHTVAAGEYLPHLKRWLAHFPREQMHLICYEAMLENPQQHLAALCSFLGITCPKNASLPRENSGRTARILALQLVLNQLRRRCGPQAGAFASAPSPSAAMRLLAPVEAWNHCANRPAPMAAALHHALDVHYVRMNAGLDDLIGIDLKRYWYQSL